MRYILVTGAREYPDMQTVRFHVLDFIDRDGTILVHGAARGVDTEAADAFKIYVFMSPILTANGCMAMPFLADWDKHGRAAGPIRNQKMVDYVVKRRDLGHEVFCLAFPLEPRQPHSGTWDCIDRMQRAGFEPLIFPARVSVGAMD